MHRTMPIHVNRASRRKVLKHLTSSKQFFFYKNFSITRTKPWYEYFTRKKLYEACCVHPWNLTSLRIKDTFTSLRIKASQNIHTHRYIYSTFFLKSVNIPFVGWKYSAISFMQCKGSRVPCYTVQRELSINRKFH